MTSLPSRFFVARCDAAPSRELLSIGRTGLVRQLGPDRERNHDPLEQVVQQSKLADPDETDDRCRVGYRKGAAGHGASSSASSASSQLCHARRALIRASTPCSPPSISALGIALTLRAPVIARYAQ